MTIRYDEKGKYFTDVITKEEVQANIQTLTHRIQGEVHVRIGERIKDEMDQTENFLAVTNAEIFNLKGKKIYEVDFMLVNRGQIIWLVPEGEEAETQNGPES